MSLHPAIVHIPIGLLLAYSVTEVFTIWARRSEWTFVKSFLLFFGLLGTFAAVITGLIAEQSVTDPIVSVHKLFAFSTIAVYAVLTAAYLPLRKNLPKQLVLIRAYILRTPVKVSLALVGILLITITGSLGAMMSHGPSNFISQLVYDVLVT